MSSYYENMIYQVIFHFKSLFRIMFKKFSTVKFVDWYIEPPDNKEAFMLGIKTLLLLNNVP